MSTVIFYEKPGCINNTKQKALLAAAGHVVDPRNLLTEPWTPARLQQFFGDRPIAQCFNQTAPAIKSGQVQPDCVDAETALALMVQDPLLIRRPLMQVGDRCEVGFDKDMVDRWIGLQAAEGEQEKHDQLILQDLETCPNPSTIPANDKTLTRGILMHADAPNPNFDAYYSLIDDLLQCPAGDEPEVLSRKPELLNSQLVQTMLQVAAMLAHNNQQEPSKFLVFIARKLAENLRQEMAP